MLKLKFKIKKVFLLINKDSFLQENNWKIIELWKIIINIQRDSTLQLVLRLCGTYCYIIYDGGKKYKIDRYCDCCCNTIWLKERIAAKLGIETKYQILTVGGKIIKDNESLRDNGIFGGKEVNLSINKNV